MNPMFSSRKKTQRPSGFTLTELLLVITIMAVMATMTLGVMRGATEDAKEAATRSRIRQIEAMLQIELENYEVRRLPVSIATLKGYAGTGSSGQLKRVRDLKRQMLADIIKAEMPQAFQIRNAGPPETFPYVNNPDLSSFPTNQTYPLKDEAGPGFGDWLDTNYSGLRGALASVRPAGAQHFAKFSGDAKFDLPGEYLYEILSRIDHDGVSGVESLGTPAIADSDADDYPEVVDAWDQPLELRVLQVDVDAGGNDLPVDWTNRDPVTLMPQGYTYLNPTVPRDIEKIRFQVISRSLGLGQ